MNKQAHSHITLKGLQQNNLKDIQLNIPKNQLVVVTGVSGSGKSSLAFDVIQKESQRHFFSQLSASSSRLGSKMQKARAGELQGLTPCISVSQLKGSFSPRSTVGTLSEVYDYLRLLFARLGQSEDKDLLINRSLFSFNTQSGACPHCQGLGVEDKIAVDLLIEDENRSIREKAFKVTQPNGYTMYSQVTIDALNQVCEAHGFNVDIPWKELTEEQQNIVLRGSDKVVIPYGKHTLESRMKWSGITAKPREEGHYKGILPVMEDILRRDRNPNILKYARTQACSVCKGTRLTREAHSVKIQSKTIADYHRLSLQELDQQLSDLRFSSEKEMQVFEPIREAIRKRLQPLLDFGLGYLQLSRNAAKLNAGEVQRIRLARQLHHSLRNLTYVFDEPSIGVHPAQNTAIIKALMHLVNLGNTVIVVEHDAQMIRSADWIIEIGPKAGSEGGELLFNGSLHDYLQSEHKSPGKAFVQNAAPLSFPDADPEADGFELRKATIHNLKDIDVSFKYKQLNVVCGVAGAGKSSLIYHSLLPILRGEYHKQLQAMGNPELHNANFKKVYEVDQSPIGKTVRSTPATYTKIQDAIRDLFASLPEAKEKGLSKSSFSYNSKGGRCETCEGAGRLETGMHFLGNVESICPTCKGKRYRKEILEISYKGLSISDVLDLRITEANELFRGHKKLSTALQTLSDIGLGYLQLGQSSNTLSGGEAQRIKLATELIKSKSGDNLYILNEPSTGLHHNDLQVLLKLFAKMLDQGNTLILIEHNEEIISLAQHIIEIGPQPGVQGGEVVFSGSKEAFAQSDTLTSKACKEARKGLKRSLNHKPTSSITLNGLRTHHLDIDQLTIEDGKHTVIYGPSGSGKSSLAFDTLYVEARNRYLESFPAYLRQNLLSASDARIESIEGLTSSVALRQRNDINDPRSTVGTLSESYDLFRLFFARLVAKDQHHSDIDLQHSSTYSFNQSEGACPHCKGLGEVLSSSIQMLCDKSEQSVFDGAFKAHKSLDFLSDKDGQYIHTLQAVERRMGMDFHKPVAELSKQEVEVILFGSGAEVYEVEWKYKRKGREGVHQFSGQWEGFVPLLLDIYYRKEANGKGMEVRPLLKEVECPQCQGSRFRREVQEVRMGGLNITDCMQLTINRLQELIKDLKSHPEKYGLDKTSISLHGQLIEDTEQKLAVLDEMGLGYIALNRKSMSLSGGELQKLLLAKVLNSKMSGICYVLDEPTSGLHASDTDKILSAIHRIVEQGNTVVSIEHNMDFIRKADHLLQLGPGAGSQGGKIVPYSFEKDLSNYLKESPQKDIATPKDTLKVIGANARNLKDIDTGFNLHSLNVVCGVSGSGKSTLMQEVVYASWSSGTAASCRKIEGLEHVDAMHWIDRTGATASSASTLVSYLSLYVTIRKEFAKQAKAEGQEWKSTHFGFQNKQTQCPECKGKGQIHTKLDFINDVLSPCEQCKGQRFIPALLAQKLQGKNIAEVLDMSLSEARNFFSSHASLSSSLEILSTLGLGYLKLGQSTSAISGGEAQRLKIATHLLKANKGHHLFIFDEPGKGLYISDLHYLRKMFRMLIEQGHTLVIIEHNPLLIREADWIIELGEGSGEQGGKLVFEGSLNELLNENTKTSKALKDVVD